MLKILNPINFNSTLSGDLLAFQIADLLNKHNKLKLKHNIHTIKADSGDYLVYYEDGKVVGCTALKTEHPTLSRNYHTSVALPYRNKGIGSYLIRSAIDSVNTSYLFATIRRDNTKSINLYKKHNFIYIKDESPEIIIMGRRKA